MPWSPSSWKLCLWALTWEKLKSKGPNYWKSSIIVIGLQYGKYHHFNPSHSEGSWVSYITWLSIGSMQPKDASLRTSSPGTMRILLLLHRQQNCINCTSNPQENYWPDEDQWLKLTRFIGGASFSIWDLPLGTTHPNKEWVESSLLGNRDETHHNSESSETPVSRSRRRQWAGKNGNRHSLSILQKVMKSVF